MTAARPIPTVRTLLFEQLHRTYPANGYNNWLVWAGNLTLAVDGVPSPAPIARAYTGAEQRPQVAVQVELFVDAIKDLEIPPDTVDARLWTDANQPTGPGYYLPMSVVCDQSGRPELKGDNLVFETAPIPLQTTGVFNFTAQFSADGRPNADPDKAWIPINEMAQNRDGVLVVSPAWVAACPSIAEVCVRKVGATLKGGQFCSGTFAETTRQLDHLTADVVYLLPFFKPGFKDLHTGEDVRKGELGSVYAVADFYQLDPEFVTPPEEVDLAQLAAEGLLQGQDLAGLVPAAPTDGAQWRALADQLDRDTLIQLVGRAQLRQLVRRAHALGKKVIFDLVLMQTSRDNPLIEQHPDWYVQDKDGRPCIHQIAWLVYSDVALFDLVFNEALQDYLLEIAPHWIETCGLDGVRIDASQTVDRPFLKRIKNRINALQPDALVLGESLCPLEEAVDIPVDMVYALLVDFHRDAVQASPLIDFLEEMHRRFAPGTVALAYFENHDSPRATQVWHQRFAQHLKQDSDLAGYWKALKGPQLPPQQRARLMALLKNLQATAINLSAGSATGCNLAMGYEWGSEWGEEIRTDFENPTLIDSTRRAEPLGAALSAAYQRLNTLARDLVVGGQIYFQRNQFAGGDITDHILAYLRYTDSGALLAIHNLDAGAPHWTNYNFANFAAKIGAGQLLFDSYAALGVQAPPLPKVPEPSPSIFYLHPLQSQLWHLEFNPPQKRA